MELKKGERDSVFKKVRRKLWMMIAKNTNLTYEFSALNIYLTDNIKKLKSFSNKHLQKRCFIIGNCTF